MYKLLVITLSGITIAIVLATVFHVLYRRVHFTDSLYLFFGLIGLLLAVIGQRLWHLWRRKRS